MFFVLCNVYFVMCNMYFVMCNLYCVMCTLYGQKHDQTCLDTKIEKKKFFAKTRLDMSRHVQKCLDMSSLYRHVQTCPDMSLQSRHISGTCQWEGVVGGGNET